MKINYKKLIPVLITINFIIYSGLTYTCLYKSRPIILGANLNVPINGQKQASSAPIPELAKTVSIQAINKIIDPPKQNRFPYGQCTWYVATKRNVPWNGNAKDWFYNSQKFGRAVGKEPKVGAILVTRESGYGHVAYVESVNGASFTVSEMNNPYWGKVTKRTLTKQKVPVIGFIY